MPVTKSELIEQLAADTKLPKGKAEHVINIIFDSMIEALQRGDRIEVRGFGSFEVRDYKAYEGRNPRTGDSVHVDPKKLPFFKVGKELRERVNRATLPQPGRDGARKAAEQATHAERAEVSTFTAPGTTEQIAVPSAEPEAAVESHSAPSAQSGTPEIEIPSVEY
jgi:integration host factor subunit beta